MLNLLNKMEFVRYVCYLPNKAMPFVYKCKDVILADAMCQIDHGGQVPWLIDDRVLGWLICDVLLSNGSIVDCSGASMEAQQIIWATANAKFVVLYLGNEHYKALLDN